MAEILFAAQDLDSGYLLGDPIVAMPDGHTWSAAELLPPKEGGLFARVRILNVTAEQVSERIQQLYEPAQPGDVEFEAEDPSDRFVRRHRRSWRIMVSELPNNVRRQLNVNGLYETDLATVRRFVRKLRYERAFARVEASAEVEF